MKRWAIVLVSVLAVSAAWGQALLNETIFNQLGRPVPNAQVLICTPSATGTPCTPLAHIFTDEARGTEINQATTPLLTDALGRVSIYALPGLYVAQVSGAGITTRTYKVVVPFIPTNASLLPVTADTVSAHIAATVVHGANGAVVGQGDLLSGTLGASFATLSVAADPTVPLGVATKQYVDNSDPAKNCSFYLTAQACLDAAGVGGRVMFSQDVTTATALSPYSGQVIECKGGDVLGNTGVRIKTTGAIWAFALASPTSTEAYNVTVRDCTFDLHGNASALGGMNLRGIDWSHFENVKVLLPATGAMTALLLDGQDAEVPGRGWASYWNDFFNLQIYSLDSAHATNSHVGVKLVGKANDNHFYGGFAQRVGIGVQIDAADNSSFHGFGLDGWGTNCIKLGAFATNNTFQSPRCETVLQLGDSKTALVVDAAAKGNRLKNVWMNAKDAKLTPVADASSGANEISYGQYQTTPLRLHSQSNSYFEGLTIGTGATAEQYACQVFTDSEDAPIWRICKDNVGYLRLATAAGAVHFLSAPLDGTHVAAEGTSPVMLNMWEGAGTGGTQFGSGGGTPTVVGSVDSTGKATFTSVQPSAQGQKLGDTGKEFAVNTTILKVVTGVDTTGAGLKHKRFTASDAVGAVMCQTGASIGATCNNVFNAPGTAFADSSYTIACSVAGSATGVPAVQQAVATTASTFTVTIAAQTAVGAQASYVGCVLVHD